MISPPATVAVPVLVAVGALAAALATVGRCRRVLAAVAAGCWLAALALTVPQ